MTLHVRTQPHTQNQSQKKPRPQSQKATRPRKSQKSPGPSKPQKAPRPKYLAKQASSPRRPKSLLRTSGSLGRERKRLILAEVDGNGRRQRGVGVLIALGDRAEDGAEGPREVELLDGQLRVNATPPVCTEEAIV